ncbi:MAG: gliding motility-associated C-terminal domain-containing protein [Crocinitomicaceae bacterium]|nr:gliding motility-associated C-terminal domain-containing protein [Crocinitomicaceae bacterium]
MIASDTNSITVALNYNSIVTLSYFADDGCLVNEKFILYVKPKVPNIITPINNDGINDVFYIFGLLEESTIYVLNRWGNVVFTENDYQNNWSPHDLTAGVYFYRLDLKDSGRIFQGMFYIQ